MKKSGGILFLFGIFLGVILLNEGVSAWPWCGGFDCGEGACPQGNICPTSSSPYGSDIFRFIDHDGSGDNVCVADNVVCNQNVQCQVNSCLNVLYYDDNADNICDWSECPSGSTSVTCIYTSSGKLPASWRWYYTGTSLPQEKPVYPTLQACNDGYDNDCDGKYDYNGDGVSIPGDPSCCIDSDNDGYNLTTGGVCGTVYDCNDANSSIHPGATEICGTNGVNEDCINDADCDDMVCAFLPQCMTGACVPETGALCSDGVSNDCDACTDGADTNCGGLETTNGGLANCGDGLDNNCNGEKDWDSQRWSGGYPSGQPSGYHGDVSCAVGFVDTLGNGEINFSASSPGPYYENTHVYINCYTNVDGILNSVNAFVLEGTTKSYCSYFGSAGIGGVQMFDCLTGTPGTKNITCTVNQSRSYNSTGDAAMSITVLSPPEPSCPSVSNCKGYTTPETCRADCNDIWEEDQPDNLECGAGVCSTGGTEWNACGCEWNGSACNFGYNPEPCGVCGNGLIEPGENCDGSNITITCSNVGSNCDVGTPSCTSSCTVNTSSCSGGGCNTGSCGDGAKNDRELCDGNNLGGLTCASFNLQTGILSCIASGTKACQFDTSRCVNISAGGWCSVGNENIVKQCNEEPNWGYTNYTWQGTWYGGAGGSDETECENDPFSKLVLCPSSFQLPFFNMFSFVLAGIGITIVYYFLIRKKKIVLV